MRRGTVRPLRTRAARAVAVPVAVATALTTGALVAPAATASTPAPRVVAVGGDHVVSAAWSAVPQARTYTVRVSAHRSLAHARTITTSERSVRIHGTNGRPYYLAVTPVVAGGHRSGVVRAVPAAGVPLPVGRVRVQPGEEQDQVRVTWTGGGRASKVAVVAGSNVVTNERSFHSDWYPAAVRSITITVPKRYRPYLGAGTGNPVWVKVVQSNSSSRAYGPAYSYARKYRPSTLGTWSFARAVTPTASVSKLKVAELNIQSFGATDDRHHFSSTNQWSSRAPRVAKYVNASAPDVLTTAELATNMVSDCRNPGTDPYACASHTQVADFARRVHGLKLADEDTYDRVIDQMRSSSRWAKNSTDGAHVFYNPATLRRLDWGYFSPAMSPGMHFGNVRGLGVSNWTGKNAIGGDRWLSWAELQTKDSAERKFFVVAAHLPVGDSSAVVNARYELVQKLLPQIDRMAGDLPVIFGADMNADSLKDAKAGHGLFMKDGWFDAGAVPAKSLRTGMKVSTCNGSGAQDGKDPGYGSKPVRHPYETTRIDYILMRHSPYTYRYANVLHLHSDGTFDKSMQGTDHNMQLATIGIASPKH